MNKKFLVIMSVLIIILVCLGVNSAITGNSIFSFGKEKVPTNTNTNTVQMILTMDNLDTYLEGQKIVKDLPKEAVIGLQFYSYKGDEKVLSDQFLIKKGIVTKGEFESANPDIVIYMSTKEFSLFGDLCNAVKTANQNGDLGYDMRISKTSLMWKYKGLLSYKHCF